MHIYKSRRQGHKTQSIQIKHIFSHILREVMVLSLALGDKITPKKKKISMNTLS